MPNDSVGAFNSIACCESNTITSDFDFNTTRSAVPINCDFANSVCDVDCRIVLFSLNAGNVCVLVKYIDDLSSLIFSTVC